MRVIEKFGIRLHFRDILAVIAGAEESRVEASQIGLASSVDGEGACTKVVPHR
jgi:hypothetical protein